MTPTLDDALADPSARVAAGCTDTELIDVITELERAQRAAVAVQAEAITALSTQIRVREMPHTFTALRAGRVDEWTVTGIVRETAILSAARERCVSIRPPPKG